MTRVPSEVERALDACLAACEEVRKLQVHSQGKAYDALVDLRALVEEAARLLTIRKRRSDQQRASDGLRIAKEAPREPIR